MIVIYTSPGCAGCRKLKSWLKDKSIDYVEKNIFKVLLNPKEIKHLLMRSENGTDDIISKRAREERTMGEKLMGLFAPFAKLAAEGMDPSAPEAQAVARRIQAYITEHFYPCTDEVFAGVGAMYGSGGDFTRNIDAVAGEGAAEFAAKVIAGL